MHNAQPWDWNIRTLTIHKGSVWRYYAPFNMPTRLTVQTIQWRVINIAMVTWTIDLHRGKWARLHTCDHDSVMPCSADWLCDAMFCSVMPCSAERLSDAMFNWLALWCHVQLTGSAMPCSADRLSDAMFNWPALWCHVQLTEQHMTKSCRNAGHVSPGTRVCACGHVCRKDPPCCTPNVMVT